MISVRTAGTLSDEASAADADRPLEAAVVIFGDIEPRGGVELDRAVVEDRRGGEPAMLDHLRIEMRFQRRARLPLRVGAIDLSRGRFKPDAAEIGRAHV